MLATGLANTSAECSSTELLTIEPPSGQSCSSYLKSYVEKAGGYIVDTNGCQYCTIKDTNTYLASVNARYSERWRNFGLVICFIAVNIVFTALLYWIARVPKGNRERRAKRSWRSERRRWIFYRDFRS
ncbi:unnamed protein product [Candida parapsilosis]